MDNNLPKNVTVGERSKLFEESIKNHCLDKLKLEEKFDKKNFDATTLEIIKDSLTSTSACLSLGIGITLLVTGSVVGGAGAVAAGAVAGLSFAVDKLGKRKKKLKAKELVNESRHYACSRLICIIRDVAKELSCMFEYQIHLMEDDQQVEKLAECAANMMLDVKDRLLFDRNTLIGNVLKDGKTNSKKVVSKTKTKLLAWKVFRKSGLRRTSFETNRVEFEYLVKPDNACNTSKYGYRGEFLEIDENETGTYFKASAIDSEYGNPDEEPSETYYPTHVLVKHSAVLNSFANNLQSESSLANFLRHILIEGGLSDEHHLVFPVYRQQLDEKFPDMKNAIFLGSDFSHSQFMKCSLQGCVFSKCVMLFVNMTGANISGASIDGTLISHSIIERVEARDCDVLNSSIEYSTLNGTNLPSSSVNGGTSLVGSNTWDRAKCGNTAATNCFIGPFEYYPREKLDDGIREIKKGKLKTLHGITGTGKTSAALHYIHKSKQKFSISWSIDVSKDERSIEDSLKDLAEIINVPYSKLFKEIERNPSGDVIFLLDNVEAPPSGEWFKQLWSIRNSVYIIITTKSVFGHLNIPDVEYLSAEKFDEAMEFLKDIRNANSEEDLQNLCKQFGWNILGLTVAKRFIVSQSVTVSEYLEMICDKKSAIPIHEAERNSNECTLYVSLFTYLEKVDCDKFPAVAASSVISNNMIPEFLLSTQLSSNNQLENSANLLLLRNQLNSLVHITQRDGIRFFSFHPFLQLVICGMVDDQSPWLKSLKSRERKHINKADVLKKMAEIFVRYFWKDNRFSKGDFLQRCMRQHTEIFLKNFKEYEKDERALIAEAQISKLLGFAYTQQHSQHSCFESDGNFEHAKDLLHKLCGIISKDQQLVECFSESSVNDELLRGTTRKDQQPLECFSESFVNHDLLLGTTSKDQPPVECSSESSVNHELLRGTTSKDQPPVECSSESSVNHDLLRGTTSKDQQPIECSGEGSIDKILEMHNITKDDFAASRQLFAKLRKKSSELDEKIIEELVFSRTISKKDLSLFPEDVRENEALKKSINIFKPILPSCLNVLINHGVALSVKFYRELFLPELYLSVIYSYGRNYFYNKSASMEQLGLYIKHLKLAYCLSREICKEMQNTEIAVLHEFLVETNALLYLLVNDDYVGEHGRCKKADHIYVKDLETALERYQALIKEERRFFEFGILKKTKDDRYSKLVCYGQILKCYEKLIPRLEKGRDQRIKQAVQFCNDFWELLNTDDDRNNEDLVQYSKYLIAIATFFLSIERKEYYFLAKECFIKSAEHAKKYSLTSFYFDALLGVADVYSRTQERDCISYLNKCKNDDSFRYLRQRPEIQERILKIEERVEERALAV